MFKVSIHQAALLEFRRDTPRAVGGIDSQTSGSSTLQLGALERVRDTGLRFSRGRGMKGRVCSGFQHRPIDPVGWLGKL